MSYSTYVLNERISNIQALLGPIIPSPTPGELVVVDKIVVADQYPAPTQTTTITPTDIVLDDGVNTNTLNTTEWTGNIQTVNTVANLVHYLNFSDSSGTGYGHPQKTAGISCNPSTNSITATSFIGSSSSSTSAVGVDLTSDNSPTTCFIPFSKTATATGNSLFVDNTILPLTYVPNSSTLTATVFSGSATTAAITDTNDATTYYPVFVSAAGVGQTLRADIATNPLSYEPSTGLLLVNNLALLTTATTATFAGTTLTLNINNLTYRNFSVTTPGITNTLATLTLNSSRVNGVYYVGILNSGTGNLTINTGLVGYYLKYTSAVVVPASGFAVMTINVLIINSVNRIIVDAYNIT